MTEKDEKDKKEPIKVVDRRRVSDSVESATNQEEGEFDSYKDNVKDFAQTCKDFPEKMDFVTFILSMSQTALLSMGCGPHPETGKTDCDLRSAKCTIDILEVIQEKTKGNLTGEEERILERILTELRLLWVEKKKSLDSGKLQ